MRVTRLSALSLNVPRWFARADFQAWLNAPGKARASWHTPGERTGEYSDTFITFDHSEGSDFDELFPADLHALICQVCAENGLSYGLLRLTNEVD